MLVRFTVYIRKLLSIIAVAVMVVAGFSACAQNSNSNPTTTNQNKTPIKIGFTVPLSGDFSGDGKFTLQGYQLWAQDVNSRGGLLGRQVQLDYLSDASKDEQAATNYRKLISVDHVDLVVGPFGFQSVPAAKVASTFGYAFINGTGTTGDFFALGLHNVFTTSLPTDNYFASFALYILSLPQSERPKSVAYATADDPFTKPQVDVARKMLENGGVTTAVYQTYPDEATDWTPIAQKIIQSGAQAVVLGSLGVPDTSAFIQAFKQQHYNPAAFIAATGPDQGDQFTKAVGSSAEGVFVPNAGWWPTAKNFQNDQFTQSYVAKFGGTANDISSDAVQAYSVGQVLEQAVNKLHSIDNKALIQELHNDSFQTLQGTVKFDDVGRNTIGVAYLFQWQKGQLIPVYPSTQAAANPEYPKAKWS
ncbi:MAG: amino acid ABC transporter substrate-binding protein [Chloroflexota bacterium]|nr:amino acid ABC transporter substrate-binding protein [Chloroflexota bacterium]